MYAIIRAGGKQYKVEAGDTVRVEKLEKGLGEEFDVPEVLLVGGEKVFVGEPLLTGAKVRVVVVRQARASKIVVFKKKRRQGYRKTQGHRQFFTELFVKSITNPEGQTAQTEKVAHVQDPQKIQARKEAEREAAKAEKYAARGGASAANASSSSGEVGSAKASAAKKSASSRSTTGKKSAASKGAKSTKSSSGSKKSASGAKKSSATKTVKKASGSKKAAASSASGTAAKAKSGTSSTSKSKGKKDGK